MTTSAPGQLVLTMEEAADRLCISRTMMYGLVKTGDIESICIGRLRRVPIEALDEFIGRLRHSAAIEPDRPA